MKILNWLLKGDVSIQFQVHRDLLDSDQKTITSLQRRIETEGFGLKFLSERQEKGYIGYGIYGPKWISVHYTLFDLYWLGVPRDNKEYKKSAEYLLDKLWFNKGMVRKNRMQDVCVTAMIITMCSYVSVDHPKMYEIIDYILDSQYKDGGWNCSQYLGHKHSSLHTTLTVLECFDEYKRSGYTYRVKEINDAIPKGEEFILRKELFKSERTKEVIRKNFLAFPFPHRWFYDIARALDYFRRVDKAYDPRMSDALYIISTAHKKGYYKKFAKYTGKHHFTMEVDKEGSKWNTLRALRILKYYRNDLYQDMLDDRFK